MPIDASIYDKILIACRQPKDPKVDPKTSQQILKNLSQNKAKIKLGN
jgi:hypothetical protein